MPYTAPTVADFRLRFPGRFDSPGVSDDAITYALTRAARQVDESWTEDDFQEAHMLYAAAFLTSQGLGVMPTGSAETMAGIKSVKSGALSVDFGESGAKASTDPVLANQYGRQFAMLRVQNRGGPRVTSFISGCAPCTVYGW